MISGELYAANLHTDGTTTTLTAYLRLIDDEHGEVGTRSYMVSDPHVIQAVIGFVSQMLPTLEANAKMAVTLPKVDIPDAPITIEPEIIK